RAASRRRPARAAIRRRRARARPRARRGHRAGRRIRACPEYRRMRRTGLQVITDALKLIGVVAGHELPTSAEQQDALSRVNELIDSWGTHAQTMYVPRRVLVPLAVGVQTYSIGEGGGGER